MLTQNTKEQESLIIDLENKINENEIEIQNVEKQRNEEMTRLTRENEEMFEDIDDYLEVIEDVTMSIENEKNKSNDLEQKLSASIQNKLELEECESIQNKQEIDALNRKIETLSQDKDAKILSLSEAVESMDTLLNEHETAINELKQANIDLNVKNEELISQNSELAEKQTEMEEILQRIKKLEEENEKLRDEQLNWNQRDRAETEYYFDEDGIDIDDDAENEEEQKDAEYDEQSDLFKHHDDDANDANNDQKSDEDDIDSIEQEGWLEKQGKFLKKWKKRYARIEDKYLCIYDNDNTSEPIQKVDFAMMELLFSTDKPKEFTLRKQSSDDSMDLTHCFRFKDEIDTEQWMQWMKKTAKQEAKDRRSYGIRRDS
eukprot:CAMPEP_0201579350 /NCGR_PEP_ID=MMETSP0190_2-20130828/26871_1 /ASSEMBLY_ACC=CAM_ASM_000263 /TAXON_ID=37353 /ORGANISM="Rosalina sp." /LENGTH=373 /DNA_ID=CAMNT_0048013685 /DNA_START=430 /DNA_END=1551 /DNA_ORIENTATION=+